MASRFPLEFQAGERDIVATHDVIGQRLVAHSGCYYRQAGTIGDRIAVCIDAPDG